MTKPGADVATMRADDRRVGTLVPDLRGDPIDGILGVVERDEACLVVVDGDEDDWVVRFEKTDDFAAREWAENMARVYNRRRGRPGAEARWSARRPG